MRIQREMSITVPIPPSLPPSVVKSYLQTIHPIIRNLGTLSRYEETSSSCAATDTVSSDPFFSIDSPNHNNDNDNNTPCPVSSYQIFELITLAPGLTKEVTYPAYFQRIKAGVRVRANGAAGIIGWCEFTIRQKNQPATKPFPSSCSQSPPYSPPDLASSFYSPPLSVDTPGTTDSGIAISTSSPPLSSCSPSSIYAFPPDEYELYETLVVQANALLMPFVCQTMMSAHRGLCDRVLREAAEGSSLPSV